MPAWRQRWHNHPAGQVEDDREDRVVLAGPAGEGPAVGDPARSSKLSMLITME